jgi:hypothetical protein
MKYYLIKVSGSENGFLHGDIQKKVPDHFSSLFLFPKG